MKKPIRVFYSQLSGNFYATNQYTIDKRDGSIVVTGDKYDVTSDIGNAVTKHDLEFKGVA